MRACERIGARFTHPRTLHTHAHPTDLRTNERTAAFVGRTGLHACLAIHMHTNTRAQHIPSGAEGVVSG